MAVLLCLAFTQIDKLKLLVEFYSRFKTSCLEKSWHRQKHLPFSTLIKILAAVATPSYLAKGCRNFWLNERNRKRRFSSAIEN